MWNIVEAVENFFAKLSGDIVFTDEIVQTDIKNMQPFSQAERGAHIMGDAAAGGAQYDGTQYSSGSRVNGNPVGGYQE